jgi:hypothetical protein
MLKNITFVTVAVASWIGLQGSCKASSIDSCAVALKFDTKAFGENIYAEYSALSFVNQSNYEQIKKEGNINVPGYFDGEYSEFSKKRSNLESLLKRDEQFKFDSNYYRHTLSPVGAEAYAKCIAAVSNEPLVAFISSSQDSEYITVTVINNRSGTGQITLTPVAPDYITFLNEFKPLTSGSRQTVLVKSPRNKQFIMSINGQDTAANASFTIQPPLERPVFVKYQRKEIYRVYQAAGRCGAGGGRSTTGSPLRSAVNFAADAEYYLMPETIILKNKVLQGGPGIVRDPNWNWVKSPSNSDRPSTMQGSPDSCEGASAHAQSIVEYQFEIRAVSVEIKRVDP